MTSTPTTPVDNVVIATKGLQDRNTNIIAGTTVKNKGKLILIPVSSTIILLKNLKSHVEGKCNFKPDNSCCNSVSTVFVLII